MNRTRKLYRLAFGAVDGAQRCVVMLADALATAGAGVCVRRYQSPYGVLVLGVIGTAVCMVEWECAGRWKRVLARVAGIEAGDWCVASASDDGVCVRTMELLVAQLDEFFAGKRRAFDVEALVLATPFGMSVYRALSAVGYGSTVGYGELASRVGLARGARAVAATMHANALSVLLPCHRVVGAGGALAGYAGGLDCKRALLAFEAQCR